MYRRPVFLQRKLPFSEADLREFWFASTPGANSEILKQAAKGSRSLLVILISSLRRFSRRDVAGADSRNPERSAEEPKGPRTD
jgi:hypothetical protein